MRYENGTLFRVKETFFILIFSVGGHWPGSLTQAWVMTRCGHDRNYFLGHDRTRVMTLTFYWVVTETDHDPRLYFEKYSLWRIFELGILKISFRGVISYTIQAIKIIQDFIFCVFEIFLGHDPNFFLGHDPIWVIHSWPPTLTL